MSVVLVLFGFVLYMNMSRALFSEVDSRLKGMAEVMASSSHSFPSHFDLAQLDMMIAEDLGFKNQGRFIQILDNTGNIGQPGTMLKSHPLPISVVAIKKASNKEISFDTVRVEKLRHPIRMITFPIIENNEVANILQIGTSLETVEDTLNALSLTIAVGILVSLVLASLVGWFMARKSLAPVADITGTARMITAQNLDQKIEVNNPNDEVGRLAETINEMISRLHGSFKQINQFSSDVSHELRTPLTIMRGEIEVALRGKRAESEYIEVLTSCLEEVERMSLMVEELLLLSKAEHGTLKLNMLKIPLHILIDDIYETALLLTQRKNIRLSFKERCDVFVHGDKMRLRQLFLNIIDNAVKYSPVASEVEIGLKKTGDKALITFRDTGIGIAEIDKERIFERFYRVDRSRSRDIGGTGLGLAISKWIAELHGGEISVESEVGKGSTFTISLPAIQED